VARTTELFDLLSELAIADAEILQFSAKVPTGNGVTAPGVKRENDHY
jgi:hypothetical protein